MRNHTFTPRHRLLEHSSTFNSIKLNTPLLANEQQIRSSIHRIPSSAHERPDLSAYYRLPRQATIPQHGTTNKYPALIRNGERIEKAAGKERRVVTSWNLLEQPGVRGAPATSSLVASSAAVPPAMSATRRRARTAATGRRARRGLAMDSSPLSCPEKKANRRKERQRVWGKGSLSCWQRRLGIGENKN
jgi:hypothetical protein